VTKTKQTSEILVPIKKNNKHQHNTDDGGQAMVKN